MIVRLTMFTTKRKSTVKKKSKVHSVNALNQLLDLETEHDDGRGLECFTKAGKLRRQMCVKMAKSAVLQSQNKVSTTMTCVAKAYEKETKHARDQALLRGRLYSRKQQQQGLFFEDDDDDDQSVQSLRSVQSTQSMRSTKSTKSYTTSASTSSSSSSRRQQQRRRQLLGKKKTRRG